MLYIVLGILGAILFVLVVLSLVAPKSATVERSIVVEVPQDEAFEYLRSLEKFNEWSPWASRDPSMQQGSRGSDGEVGSVSWWKGNKEVGEGEQEVIELKPNSHIGMELRFVKPFRATNEAWLDLAPAGEGTKVSWGFHAKFSPPMNIMMMFMSLDKTIGGDYESGLSRMKEIMEAGPA